MFRKPENLTLSAIILAGGQSKRMGQDKALLMPQGTPLLQQVIQVAGQCAEEVYVVTPWPERYQAIIANQCKFIQETDPDGPLVALSQGLAQVKTDWVLVLACDLPWLQVEVLQSWVAQLVEVQEEVIACLPKDARGWQPLCGFYRQRSLPLLQEYIQQGGRSFQSWLPQYPVEVLPVRDLKMLFNCNTPADLEVIQKPL